MPNMLREMCGEPISTPALPNASAESRSHEPTSFALERQAILQTESPSLPSCLHRAPGRTFPPGLVAQCGEDDGISDLRTGGPEPKIYMASHNNLSFAKRASILASTNSYEPTQSSRHEGSKHHLQGQPFQTGILLLGSTRAGAVCGDSCASALRARTSQP